MPVTTIICAHKCQKPKQTKYTPLIEVMVAISKKRSTNILILFF